MLVCVTLFDSKFLDTRLSCLPRTLVKKTITQSPTSGGTRSIWSFPLSRRGASPPTQIPALRAPVAALCDELQAWPSYCFHLFLQTWDPLLAQIAKAWASHCEFAHNKQLKPPYKLHPNFTSLGENLWTGSLSIFSVSSAITAWYDEVKYYEFNSRKCNKVCGHYTQVRIWPIFSRNGHLMGEGKTGIWCEENRVC